MAIGAVLAASLAALAACGSSNNTSTTTTSAASRSGGSSTATGPEVKMVPSTKFEKTDITIDAGRTNFSLYKTKEDADAAKDELAKTDICTAPCLQTADVNVTAGEYFFHCDVHPSQMTGTLTAK
ncbi:MAG: hypothetical protein E6J43_02025 [Chloroflexi bacterium]|nr:MAG: hypothetical protein E6J43_02025 [Chloroflexota bacterium]